MKLTRKQKVAAHLKRLAEQRTFVKDSMRLLDIIRGGIPAHCIQGTRTGRIPASGGPNRANTPKP